MRLSLCTITFRHHLLSLEEIARWARQQGFGGIELWAVHARNMQHMTDRDAAWMGGLGLSVPMISDYLPLGQDSAALRHATADVCRLAQRWGARKVRTFAGQFASKGASPEARRAIVWGLRQACSVAQDAGCRLLVETHPETLADTIPSTLRLIDEVDHPALGVNFDTLHVWEGGDDPVVALKALGSKVIHFHLKNIVSRDDLSVFAPGNVYAPSGVRKGMMTLFDGAYDYLGFFEHLAGKDIDMSLEWFGDNVFAALELDARNLRALWRDISAPLRAGVA